MPPPPENTSTPPPALGRVGGGDCATLPGTGVRGAMRAIYGCVAIMFVLAGCSGPSSEEPDVSTVVAERQTSESQTVCQQAVADTLKDPASAQFRDVTTNIGLLADQGSGTARVDGQVNGKNGYGGYVGYKPFTCRAVGVPGVVRAEDVKINGNTP